MDKIKLKKFIKKWRDNNLNDLKDIKELSTLLNVNPFYIKNPSSWDIMKSILIKAFWLLNDDNNIHILPENWL